MKATVTLSQEEIVKAIDQYVRANGWKPEGQVQLDIRRGYDDPRESCPDTVSATIVVGKA